ncbi:LD-carboxypeptidase [Candidatus Shapirobacteria bacterium]|nr:MAG: LD-carboxypeptidase [Candidatus Shapirobacteria bacterium]
MIRPPKLQLGDKVAIVSPSFAGPGQWPEIYQLGLHRLTKEFKLKPVEFPTTRQVRASARDRSVDLISAFRDKKIKAIIASLGGNDQVTYVKNLPNQVFREHPKAFFGFSDNTHLSNHLWLNSIISYYGGMILTQFAFQQGMDPFTIKYLKKAMFVGGWTQLEASHQYNDIDLDWADPNNISKNRVYENNSGWFWDGQGMIEGISWGGCLESIDEMLRHGIAIPSLTDFENIILFTETSEETPSKSYVFRVYRALGERGILAKVKAFLVGRPKAWSFENQQTTSAKKKYRQAQRETIIEIIRRYNPTAPIVQNLDIGHTEPQIPLPYGGKLKVDTSKREIWAKF